MEIRVSGSLHINKSENSWDVVETLQTKKEDGTTGTRKKMTYHGTLAQALQKVVDMEMEKRGKTDEWNDFHCLLRNMTEIHAEMQMIANRIETATVLQV